MKPYILLSLLLAQTVSALPKYVATKLPFPAELEASDVEMASFVASLDVFQDHDNPDHYYYVPTFRAYNFAQGAGNVFLHHHQISLYSELAATLRERTAPQATNLAALDLRAITLLEMAGVTVGGSDFKAILEGAKKLSQSYGGSFTMGLYAGFTKGEVAWLREFKQKYAPNIKIALISIDAFSYEPLTEIGQANHIFRHLGGGGSFAGATINLDLTVAGAMHFATNNSAFFAPVMIKGRLTRKANPFHAVLDCDFRCGWMIKGRTDVKDGLIVFNNDLINAIKADDIQNGECQLRLLSGDRQSAELKALEIIEAKMVDQKIIKTQLSTKDKEAYFAGIIKDTQGNRHKGTNIGLGQIFSAFASRGWIGAGIFALSKASSFYWHTNAQNVENLSGLKFRREIKSNHDETISMPLPVSICLVYNATLRAYTGCQDTQNQVLTLYEANQKALRSEACESISDPAQCGQARQANAPTDKDGNLL